MSKALRGNIRKKIGNYVYCTPISGPSPDSRRQKKLGIYVYCTPILVAILMLAVPAKADTWKGDALLAQLAKARLKMGPIRIQPQLVLSDMGYDSNVYHQPNAIADYSLTAGPQINAFLSLKRKIIFTLTESPRYVYYFETARERTWNNYLSANVSFLFNKFFIQAGAHDNNAKQRWSYEIDLRPRLRDTGYDASILWQPSKKTSFSVGYRQSNFRYENIADDPYEIAGRLNRGESYVNFGYFNQLTPRTRAFLDFEYGQADFELASNTRDAVSYAGYGGLEFSTIGRIRGRVRLGYKSFHPLTAGLPDYKGLVGDTNLSVTILRPLVLRGSYRRDVKFSTWYGYPYYIEDSSGAGLSFYVLRRRFRLDYDYSQLKYDYPSLPTTPTLGAGEDPVDASTPTRRDRVYMNTLGLFFRLSGDVGVGIRAGRYSRRVNVYNWKVSRNFIGLNLTYEF
jgi:hypothetical protein